MQTLTCTFSLFYSTVVVYKWHYHAIYLHLVCELLLGTMKNDFIFGQLCVWAKVVSTTNHANTPTFSRCVTIKNFAAAAKITTIRSWMTVVCNVCLAMKFTRVSVVIDLYLHFNFSVSDTCRQANGWLNSHLESTDQSAITMFNLHFHLLERVPDFIQCIWFVFSTFCFVFASSWVEYLLNFANLFCLKSDSECVHVELRWC